MSFFRCLLIICFLQSVSACGGDGGGVSGEVPDSPYSEFFTPLIGERIYPASNPYSPEKERLGELLFWDPILSGDRNVSCATCHHPQHGWADGRELSIGVDGVGLGPDRVGDATTEFHSPSIINVAFTGLSAGMNNGDFVSGPYFWDLRANTLEAQALDPILSQVEMRGFSIEEGQILSTVTTRLKSNEEYRRLFDAAFTSGDPISAENIVAALATFQRRIVTGTTRFDIFLQGDESVFSEQELTGLNKFINAGCARCHRGPMLSDFLIHVDQPVLTGDDAVRTPSLRNVELTAPYMHDGSHQSLGDAIAQYEGRGDLEVTLGESDFGDIEAFLKTLTDTSFYQAIPASVPSGLPVGGNIAP